MAAATNALRSIARNADPALGVSGVQSLNRIPENGLRATGYVLRVLGIAGGVGILLAGYGLLTLVCATTAVRLTAYLVYRSNAYRVFPELRIRPSLFCRRRLREVTGFSVYSAAIDWANSAVASRKPAVSTPDRARVTPVPIPGITAVAPTAAPPGSPNQSIPA